LNYCFGHSDSDVLLCPYGMLTGLINHNSHDKVNAKIVWNNDFSSHKEWKDQPLEKWIYEDVTGLAFDFVATKGELQFLEKRCYSLLRTLWHSRSFRRFALSDIEPGEEVYIDYGDEWQAAWEAHIQRWKPPLRAESYRPAAELNQDEHHIVRTVDEALYQDVRVMCHHWYRYLQGHRVANAEDSFTQADYCRPTSRRITVNGETLYTAELYNFVSDVDECYEVFFGVLFDLPRQVFLFVDLPYTSDMHQPWAFRQAMMIPDEIMPDAWRNIADGR
jgi:hypothetical protein